MYFLFKYPYNVQTDSFIKTNTIKIDGQGNQQTLCLRLKHNYGSSNCITVLLVLKSVVAKDNGPKSFPQKI